MLSFFRSRTRNEEIAREQIEDQIRILERDQIKNNIKQRVTDLRLKELSKQNISATNSKVNINLTKSKLLEQDQQRILRTYASLQSKLINLNSAGTTLAELKMLPTYNAATKISKKSVIKAQNLMNKIQENTNNQESLEEILLSEVNTDTLTDEWQSNLEQFQADQIETGLIEKQKIRLNNLNI
jgi:hypothetical protein